MKANKIMNALKPYPEYDVLSDSGWECDASDIQGILVNHTQQIIILKQSAYDCKEDKEKLYAYDQCDIIDLEKC